MNELFRGAEANGVRIEEGGLSVAELSRRLGPGDGSVCAIALIDNRLARPHVDSRGLYNADGWAPGRVLPITEVTEEDSSGAGSVSGGGGGTGAAGAAGAAAAAASFSAAAATGAVASGVVDSTEGAAAAFRERDVDDEDEGDGREANEEAASAPSIFSRVLSAMRAATSTAFAVASGDPSGGAASG